MNSKIKKILLILPFFAFSEEKKDDKSSSYIASKFAYSGSLYASYLFSMGSVSVGPVLGVEYSSYKKINALLGVQAKMGLDLGYVTGARAIVAVLIGMKSKEAKNSKVDGKEIFSADQLKKINDSSNGFFKGVFAFLGVDASYFSVGAYVKWSESSRFTKSVSAGLAVVPNIEVMDSVEVGGIGFVGYNFGADFEKLSDEQKEYVDFNLIYELAKEDSKMADKFKDVKDFESFKGVFKKPKDKADLSNSTSASEEPKEKSTPDLSSNADSAE